MKHAYLIITHEFTPVLETLIKMIDDERNDIYVHINKKVRDSFEDRIVELVKKSGICFVKRYKVYWGHVSLVKAEYELFQTARAKGHYSYFHLISGSDLPVKSQDEIHAFCDKHFGEEFISFSPDDMLDRVKFKWLFAKHLRGLLSSKKWIYRKINKLQAYFTYGFVDFQKIIGLENHAFPLYKKGSEWVSLTEKAVDVLLEYKKKALHGFRRSNCPDEHYKQTILVCVRDGLLPFPMCIKEKRLDLSGNSYRYVPWERGNGDLDLTINDYDTIIARDVMFCRKVVDEELAKKIYYKFGPQSIIID